MKNSRIRDEIERFHACLNDQELFKGLAYRRNMVGYEFISYINHIVACYYSRNYKVMIAFFWRAKKYLLSDNRKFLDRNYANYTVEYLNLIQKFIFSLNNDELIHLFKNSPGARHIYQAMDIRQDQDNQL